MFVVKGIWRVELVFVTALVSVILTELSAAETQPHGPYTFRNARLELFQTGIGSTGLRYCCRKFCKNDEDKIMTKTSSTLHTLIHQWQAKPSHCLEMPR